MAAMENSRMKLSYFDARGVAETTRYMLAVTKTPYEDFRYVTLTPSSRLTESSVRRYGFTFGTPGDFSTVQRPEFDAAKAAGKLDANLGRLPLLEIDGQVFGQSKTIERFVAKRVGMMGSTPLEEAQIDCICEHLRDCKDKYMKAKGNPETKAAYFATEMPEFMAKVEKTCVGPWLCGSKCTLADAAAFVFVKEFFDDVESSTKAIAGCPKISAAVEAFGKIPEVKQWQEKRPKTMF
jgi:glutathione S-transferase